MGLSSIFRGLRQVFDFSSSSFEKKDLHRSNTDTNMAAAFDMGPAGRVSPLVKTARWTLLIAGIWWGAKRYNALKIVEDERRAYEAEMAPIWAAAKAKRLEEENRQNMISLAHQAGVKVPDNF